MGSVGMRLKGQINGELLQSTLSCSEKYSRNMDAENQVCLRNAYTGSFQRLQFSVGQSARSSAKKTYSLLLFPCAANHLRLLCGPCLADGCTQNQSLADAGRWRD